MADAKSYKYSVQMTCGGCSGAVTRVLNKLKESGGEFFFLSSPPLLSLFLFLPSSPTLFFFFFFCLAPLPLTSPFPFPFYNTINIKMKS